MCMCVPISRVPETLMKGYVSYGKCSTFYYSIKLKLQYVELSGNVRHSIKISSRHKF